MSYTKSNLMKDEVIIHKTELHWIIFLPGIILFVYGFIYTPQYALLYRIHYAFGGLIGLIAILLLIAEFVNYRTSEFYITNKRMIMKTGFIRRRTVEILLQKVESISLTQGIIGRIIGYGTILITGTGGTPQPFVKVNKPLIFRNKAQEQLAAVHELNDTSPARAESNNSLNDLEKLSELKDKGIISESEFTQKKRMILGIE